MSSISDPPVGSPQAVMQGLLARLHGVIDDLLGFDQVTLSDAAVLDGLVELERATRRLPAVRHSGVHEIRVRGIANHHQVSSTAALLRQLLNLAPGEASAWVRQATEQVTTHHPTGEPCLPVFPAVAAAVRDGTVSSEQVGVISRMLRQVPAAIGIERRRAVEADLVKAADQFDPRPLERICQKALDCLDQDGKPPRDEVNARAFLAFGRTRRDGLTPFKGLADQETRAVLDAALAPLAQPVHADGGPDKRSRPQRWIEALRDLAKRALASGALPAMAGLPATLLLTVTLRELEARTGLVSVLSGGTIPVADVLGMAAQMKVAPIVFGHTGEILHCGRDQRLFPRAVRHATATLDRGCVIPGCDVPLPLCELHHITAWIDGGPTDIDNAAWLCPYHHHRINGWKLERIHGRIWCTKPDWLDPTATPRLNTYFHLPDLLTNNQETDNPETNWPIKQFDIQDTCPGDCAIEALRVPEMSGASPPSADRMAPYS